MNPLATEIVYERLLTEIQPALSFRSGGDFTQWRTSLAEKLAEVLGMQQPPCPLDVRVEWTVEHDSYTETRFVVTAEPGADVPCHLLVPRGERPLPVVVCLQGHSPGMHISMARSDIGSMTSQTPQGDRDYAVQVLRRGWAALVVEQRCFGERADRRPEERRRGHEGHPCTHVANVAALLGRTLIGDRVWDVRRAIDALAEFPAVDTSRIACMGNSGGGATTYYAACMDSRIGIAMPSSYVCTYRAGIGSIDHCCDNYLPGALKYFDLPDLAGLIAPRPLIVVAGKDDPIFPFAGVEEAFENIQRIYAAAGAAENCALVVGDGRHRFYADDAWPVFEKLGGW